jgi:hypothetical protein
MFNEILDPLSVGHAKAEKILEERKRQAEDAEAVERSDFEEALERQKLEEAKKEAEPVLQEDQDEKENPGEELYGRFEQFRGHKAPRLESALEGNKEDKQKTLKKKGNNPPRFRGPRSFDPYK